MSGSGLGEQREDSDAGVAADHWDINVLDLEPCLLSIESLGADHVQSGHAKQLLRVVDTHALQGLGGDGDGGVHRVGDHGNASLRAELAAGLHDALDNASVDLEEIISGHAGLTGNSGGNNNNIAAAESLAQLVIAHESLCDGLGVDVAHVGSNARGSGHIVQGELTDSWVHLHQEGQGLPDAATGTDDRDLAVARGGGGRGEGPLGQLRSGTAELLETSHFEGVGIIV
mmetsp:Transcript_40301/g.114086  ORF Transcript_40301/g.114086 Transcript_40301/m.114086 type:complete len:229 (+) Transcript_40301:591-1277(+)